MFNNNTLAFTSADSLIIHSALLEKRDFCRIFSFF